MESTPHQSASALLPSHICKAPSRSGLSTRFRTAAERRHRRHGCFKQPSNRYGVEWANYYTPVEHLTFDFALADSRARFTEIDGGDAAPDSPRGKRLPEAVGWMISWDITGYLPKGFSASLRLRYFGPRDLTSDGLYRSNPTASLNAEAGYQINKTWRVSAEFLNLLHRRDHDIHYAYTSQITPTVTPAFTDVFHPVEPFQVRFGLRRTF